MNGGAEKDIAAGERLIVALDVPSADDARALVERLGDSVKFYKLGLELFMAGGYEELTHWLRERDKRIFIDLKFFDVPQTVARAVRQLNKYGAAFATVHGNDEILKAAVEAGGDCGILAVTALTSLDQADMNDLGFDCDVKELVLSRARRALAIGCAGVISSGLEAPALRRENGSGFVIITPGIRPVVNREADDQKRTVDVEQAFENGADYIVIGRAIAQADDPKAVAEGIRGRIEKIFGS